MAFKIVWSPEALRDLEEISDYISKNSANYASAVITKILDAVDELPTFPRVGRRVPEFNRDDFREILVYQWRIMYEIGAGRIDITGVIHGAQRRWSP